MILQRLRSAGELPAALRTSLGIQLAPALVACSARVERQRGVGDTLAKMLFGYGLLQLLFMLRLMPRYLSQPFNASFWVSRSACRRWRPRGCISATPAPLAFSHAGGAAVHLYQCYHRIIAGTYVRTADAGKLLIRTARTALLKSEDKK